MILVRCKCGHGYAIAIGEDVRVDGPEGEAVFTAGPDAHCPSCSRSSHGQTVRVPADQGEGDRG